MTYDCTECGEPIREEDEIVEMTYGTANYVSGGEVLFLVPLGGNEFVHEDCL